LYVTGNNQKKSLNISMPHKKKVNKLKLKECEAILARIENQKDSSYYREVFKRYSVLVLEKENKNGS
jgi:hypothetical protein